MTLILKVIPDGMFASLSQMHPHSMMYTCLVEATQWRVVWRSSTMENGALFVMTLGI